MKTINEVRLLGNVGRDPEIRAAQSGSSVANLSLATSERFKDGDTWKEHAEWHSLVAFGKVAEIIREYVKKGSKIHVSGRLQTRTWEDSHQVTRSRTEIIVNDLVLLSSPAGKDGNDSARKDINSIPKTREDYEAQTTITDDDIPF